MDPNEEVGFSKHHALLSPGQRPAGDVPSNPPDVVTRRMATWVSTAVAVFTQIFAIAIIFGWVNLKASLEAALCAGSCVLVCGILLGGVTRTTGPPQDQQPLVLN
jgi:hypothetical protein